jgi:hypothetical protein
MYSIDGNIINVDKYRLNNHIIQLDEINNIREINKEYIHSHYEDVNGNKISLTEYEIELKKLKSKGKQVFCDDEETSELVFENVEDEINYLRFNKTWNLIVVTKQLVSDPVLIPVETTFVVDTGCPYIKSYFSLEGEVSKNSGLYFYRQNIATKEIARSIFQSLGMVEENKCDYKRTENEKVYGGLADTCMRYVTAFGGYIFSGTRFEQISKEHSPSGELQQMLDLYNKDKEELEKIIKMHYNFKFGRINTTEDDCAKFFSMIENAIPLINNIEVKSRSYKDWINLKNKIKELKDFSIKVFSK